MKYPLAVHYVASNLWAMLPSKMSEMLAVLAYRAAGHQFTAEEIKARIGDFVESPVAQTLLASAGQGRSQGGGVAIIPVRGVIAHRMSALEESSGGTSAEGIAQMLRAAMADASVGTIVLDIDSPGGTVAGVAELAGELFAMRGQGKKIVAQVNSLAASAAYWLAAQCDEIVCLPSGMAGSIGVFTVHQDLSAALAKEGVDVTLISAGKYKVEGNPFEPLSEDAKAFIQARVDEAYAQFIKDVARGRGVTPAAVRNGYGEGRALTAKDAKAAGLIDRIATMDETIARLTGRKSSGGAGGTGSGGGVDAKTLADMEDFSRANPELAAQLIQEEVVRRSEQDRAARLRLL